MNRDEGQYFLPHIFDEIWIKKHRFDKSTGNTKNIARRQSTVSSQWWLRQQLIAETYTVSACFGSEFENHCLSYHVFSFKKLRFYEFEYHYTFFLHLQSWKCAVKSPFYMRKLSICILLLTWNEKRITDNPFYSLPKNNFLVVLHSFSGIRAVHILFFFLLNSKYSKSYTE